MRRQSEWRHPSKPAHGRPAGLYQFAGIGEDTITLAGWVAPELIGSAGSLKLPHRMADTGKAYVLVDGTGEVYGAYVIRDKSEDHSYISVNGLSKRVDFSITLARVDASRARTLLDDPSLPIGAMDGSVADWGARRASASPYGYPRAVWRVTLDGRDVSTGMAPRLDNLAITECRGGEADQLDIVLH